MTGHYRYTDISVNRHADTLAGQHIGMADDEELITPGGRLRHARKLRGLSQEELAAAVGVKQSAISDLETGTTKEYSGSTLVAVARKLRVRAEWLVNRVGAMDDELGSLSEEQLQALRKLMGKTTPESAVEVKSLHQPMRHVRVRSTKVLDRKRKRQQ